MMRCFSNHSAVTSGADSAIASHPRPELRSLLQYQLTSRYAVRTFYPPLSRKSKHPSGDPTPSQADIQMTRAIVDIAGPLGISVHDHIIVGKNGHASLKGLRLI